jgi:two-component system, NarL family, response regulator LiaR
VTTVSVSNKIKLKKIRIILADDHPLMRQAIRMWLDKQPDLEVLAEASDGREAIDLALKLQPDVVIIDISMPRINGLEATRQIVSRCPETNVLVLTVHTDTEHIHGMLQAGAVGYLTKNASGEDVVHAVRTVAVGENVLPDNTQYDRADESFNNTLWASSNKLNELTHRELSILKMVAKGMHNKEIAAELGLSLRGIKAYLTTIFIKLGASSRTETVSRGLKSKILTMDDLNQSSW